MGAHAAPRPRTLGRVAGRGALTAAAALALTGGTASMAFAGTHDDDSTSHRSWDHDDRDGDYADGFRDGYRIGYHDGEDADDEDCDDDGGRDTWHDEDHGTWDDEDHDKDHHKDRDKDRDRQFGARYEDSTHHGDDIYTVYNVTKTGLLAGVL